MEPCIRYRNLVFFFFCKYQPFTSFTDFTFKSVVLSQWLSLNKNWILQSSLEISRTFNLYIAKFTCAYVYVNINFFELGIWLLDELPKSWLTMYCRTLITFVNLPLLHWMLFKKKWNNLITFLSQNIKLLLNIETLKRNIYINHIVFF